MKKIVCFLIVLAVLFSPSIVQAHIGGIPVVKINDKSTDIYVLNEFPILGEFSVPTDIGADNYLVNKQITFEVDKERFPFPDEVVKTAKYEWDFGDGKKVKGEKVKHAFNKIGSYEVALSVDFPDEFAPPPMASEMMNPFPIVDQQQYVLVHIVPNKDYKVPQIIVSIDDKEVKNLRERVQLAFYEIYGPLKLPKNLVFDASKSKGSSKIVKYFWDFDEGKDTSNKAQAKHRFTDDFYLRDIGVRVEDENNFYTVAFLSLVNSKKERTLDVDKGPSGLDPQASLLLVRGAVSLGLATIVTFGVWVLRNKRTLKK